MTLNRREFLKSALATVASGTTLELISQLKETVPIDNKLELTNKKFGNASLMEYLEDRCNNSTVNAGAPCVKNFIEDNRRNITIDAPIVEELAFRAGPASALSFSETHSIPKTLEETLLGQNLENDIDFTRRDILTGFVSSILFAAAHNITPNGFNRNVIPIHQTIEGGLFWILQRQFGICSNIAAHMGVNRIAITQYTR